MDITYDMVKWHMDHLQYSSGPVYILSGILEHLHIRGFCNMSILCCLQYITQAYKFEMQTCNINVILQFRFLTEL